MSAVVSRDGTSIAYTKTGQGPAVVLVDGAMCSRNFGPMGELSALLAPQFTVYMYDRRGRGESGDTAPYAVEREIEDIAALIAEAGGSACVYGTSSGGALALQAACKLPSIAKVAAFESPYTTDDTRPPTVDNYLPQLEALLKENRRGDAAILFMQYVGMPDDQVEPTRQSPVFPAFEAIAPTLLYDALCVENPMDGKSLPPALIEQLGALKTPALILGGGDSPEWMLNTQRAIAAAIPGAQSRTLAGQTHQVAGSVVAPVIAEFFAG